MEELIRPDKSIFVKIGSTIRRIQSKDILYVDCEGNVSTIHLQDGKQMTCVRLLKLLEQDLGMVDDSIATFKSRNKITDITHVSDLYLKQQSESAADILKISNQKAMAGYIKSLLEDPTHHQLLLVNSGISNSAVEVQINQYNDLVLQLNSHLAYTSDQNPIIVNLENEIASLRKNILGTIDMHMQSLDIELLTLQGFNEDATAKIVSNPEQAKYLMAIERDQKVKESLYLYLLQKKEENEISLTYRAAKTQVIDLPHGSNSPTSPKRNQVLFAAFLLGLILPLGVIFLSYTLNESVRRISDIEQNCDLPILGEIPFSGSRIRIKRMITGAPGKNGIIVSPTGKDAGNEAFRMLRTHMEQPADGQSRVILVSSPGEGDGKTFAAMNLAAAFALGGKRVLLLDGDLRSTSASRLMKADDAIGLADLLVSGSEAYASCLVARDDVPGMDFLPAGRTDVNPAEMLASPALRQLIGLARNRYDVIVIDSPACEKTADADILEQYADEVLLIIRAGGYDRRELPELEGRKKEGKNLSLILNITHPHKY